MKILSLFAFLLLAACAPTVVDAPVEVDKAVAVTCKVPAVPSPQWSTGGLTASNTLFEKVRAFLSADQQHKAYEASLAAANTACQ